MNWTFTAGLLACALGAATAAAADGISKAGIAAAPASAPSTGPASQPAPAMDIKPRPAPAIFTPVAGWKADNDLYEQKWKLKKGLQLTMPIKGRPQVFGSARPTPFLVVADRNPDAGDLWHILDVRTGLWPGRLAVKTKIQRPTISPDGQHAGGAISESNAEIWSLKTGTLVSTLAGPAGSREMNVVGFLEGGLVATYCTTNEAGIVQVWDMKTARALREMKLKNRPGLGAMALSPNGKYLAVNEGVVRIIDLGTCTVVGETPVPPLKQAAGSGSLPPVYSHQRLAWSLDGCEIGLLSASGYSQQQFRVVTWDMPTGQVITDIAFDRPAEERETRDPAFEIVPDNTGFRIGLTLVDREAGKPVCTLPNPVPGQQFTYSDYLQVTRMYDGERLLFVAAPSGNRVGILAMEVPRDRMARVAESIKAGGKAIDASLPPLTPANSAGARTILAGSPGDSWTYKPDTPARAAGNLRSVQAFPLRAVRGIGNGPVLNVASVRFSGLPGNQALVTYSTLAQVENRNESVNVSVERINLSTGGLLASFNPPNPRSAAVDLAADGRQVLFMTEDRLDLFTTLDGGTIKHVLGWRPYGLMKNQYSNPLAHAAVLDSTHVLTMGSDGDGIVWTLPECRALYHFKASGNARPALSPGRKHIAFQDPAGVTIIEALTGNVVASFVTPTEDRNPTLLFHPDGTLLASYAGQSRSVLVWDLATGKVVSEFSLFAQNTNVFFSWHVSWCGRGHLMIGPNLVNLANRMVVWQYAVERNQPAPVGGNMPDDRYWTTLGGAQQPALLATVLPHEDAKKAVANLPPDKACIIRPGVSVTLEVNIIGSEETRKDITARLTRALVSNGMTVADGQPLHLVASTTILPADTAKYGEGLFGARNQQTVSIPQFEHRLSFTQDGKTLWERSGRQMGASPGSVPVGESVQAAVDKMNAEPSRGFFASFRLPKYLAEGTEGLGYSALTPKGPVDVPRPAPGSPR